MNSPIAPAFVAGLQTCLGLRSLLLDPAERLAYGYDNSRRQALPDAVALPTSAEQVQALVRACRKAGVPITARGRGTNTTGASVPINGGLVVSFERMNRIVSIEPGDRSAVVEPGVLNGDLQTVKYGASRDNLLGLVAVTGTGDIVRLGGANTKASSGFDLSRLLVGSEGTLALIVETTLRIVPLASQRRVLRALYRDTASAAQAVARLMAQPTTPSMLEYMDARCIELARSVGGVELPEAGALLMIEADGDADTLPATIIALERAANGEGCIAVAVAANAAERERLWAARKALSPALRTLAPGKINEDVVVPVSRLPDLVAGVGTIATARGLEIVCFGHAGNGNLHVNILFDPADAAVNARAQAALAEVFALALALGGQLSGEHGIGLAKRDFMRQALDAPTLALMQSIKQVFDPDGILNPGKLLPDLGIASE